MTVDPLVDLKVDDEYPMPEVRAAEPFDAFFRREFRSLVGLAHALSGSQVAAEDIAQEALVSAYHHWDQVGASENPGAWVRRVVANKSVSAIRRRLSEAKGLIRLRPGHETARRVEMPADSEWIWGLVRQLPKRQAQVVALYYFDGLSMPEIGEVLGLSKDTAHLPRGASGGVFRPESLSSRRVSP